MVQGRYEKETEPSLREKELLTERLHKGAPGIQGTTAPVIGPAVNAPEQPLTRTQVAQGFQQKRGDFQDVYQETQGKLYYKWGTGPLPRAHDSEAIKNKVEKLVFLLTNSAELRNMLFEFNSLLRASLSANLMFAGKQLDSDQPQFQQQQPVQQTQQQPVQQAQQQWPGHEKIIKGTEQFTADAGYEGTRPRVQTKEAPPVVKQQEPLGTDRGPQKGFSDKSFLRIFDYELDDQSRKLLATQWQDYLRRAHANKDVLGGLQKLVLVLEACWKENMHDNLDKEHQNEIRVLKTKFEAYAGVNIGKLFQAIQDVCHRAQNDTYFWQELSILKHFVWGALCDRSYVEQPEFVDLAIAMLVRLRLLTIRHGMAISRALLKFNFVLETLRNKQLKEKLGPKDVFYMDNNRLTLKPAFLDDFRALLVPMVAEQLRGLRTPKIIGSDEMMDYEIDNIIFVGENISQHKVHIDTIIIAPAGQAEQSGFPDYSMATISIQLRDITAGLENSQFAFRYKKVSKTEEACLMNVAFGGTGINMDIELKPCATDLNRLFSVHRVRFESSKIHLRDIRGEERGGPNWHVFRPVLESRVHRAIDQAIEDCICMILERIDYKLIHQYQWMVGDQAAQQLQAHPQQQKGWQKRRTQETAENMQSAKNDPVFRAGSAAQQLDEQARKGHQQVNQEILMQSPRAPAQTGIPQQRGPTGLANKLAASQDQYQDDEFTKQHQELRRPVQYTTGMSLQDTAQADPIELGYGSSSARPTSDDYPM